MAGRTRSRQTLGRRMEIVQADLSSPRAVGKLKRIALQGPDDQASRIAIGRLLGLDPLKRRQAVCDVIRHVFENDLQPFFAAALHALVELPELAVELFERCDEIYNDARLAALHTEAGLAMVTALQSEDWEVAGWRARYRQLLCSPCERVRVAASWIVPDIHLFDSLTHEQRLTWLKLRTSIATPATSPEERAILHHVVRRGDTSHLIEQHTAIFALGMADFEITDDEEAYDQAILIGFIDGKSSSYDQRSFAIVALGLRRGRAVRHLSTLYRLMQDQFPRIQLIAGAAIAQIVADAPELPHQVEFASLHLGDGRIAVLGRLLEDSRAEIRTATASAIYDCKTPRAFGALEARLRYLASSCGDANHLTFRAAADAVA